jgi:FlaA1/EpsC-like NDP-sugar epimerase
MKTKPSIRNRYFLLGDLFLVIIAVIGSYALRLELNSSFYIYLPSAVWMIAVSLLIKPVVFYSFGLYQRLWLYAGTQELKLIVASVSSASILVSLAMISIFTLGAFTGFPRSVLIIDWMLSVLMVGGLRFTLRLLVDSQSSSITNLSRKANQVLIIGAGDAGALVARELQKNPQLSFQPVGFLDDDPTKQHQQIYGIPVIGTLTDLEKVIASQDIHEVIIAIPSAPGRVVRLVADVCRNKEITFRTMPGIYELIGGKVNISRLREVDITDLLRRSSTTHLPDDHVGSVLSGRTVLITGAGGSIGKELCRQIARWGPSELLMVGHGENSIFEAFLELKEGFPALNILPIIADIRDMPRIQSVFNRYQPQVVFHAAAHKHVPLMEINVEEAVTNNILGTRNIISSAASSNVERLVMISTDKAIRPVNIMGATKRIAEMLVLDAASSGNKRHGRVAFSVVRFGNVLGSRGSVVPLFKRQIARGGPVTITHPEMQRYFMTIPEAVYLVLQAASIGEGGETYVLNMGDQVRILDLAEDLIRLSGLEPGRDIEIVFTGVRSGEKLSEDLWDEGHTFLPTKHPDIFSQVDDPRQLKDSSLLQASNELIRLAREGDATAIMHLLDDFIYDAEVVSTPPQEMTSIG